MKGAVWYGRQDVRVEHVAEPPEPPPEQLQVEVAWCGICGTDLHEYLGGPVYIPRSAPHPLTSVKAPVIIGHEMSGRVIAVGKGVRDFSVGDRIVACPIIGCQQCRWCRSGSMAQCDKVAFLGTSWSGGGALRAIELIRVPVLSLTGRDFRRSGRPGRAILGDGARRHIRPNRARRQCRDCWRRADRLDGIDGSDAPWSETSGGRGGSPTAERDGE